jgi:hypothetical protein
MSKCDCKDVGIGSYRNQITVKTPDHTLKHGGCGCMTFRSTTCLDRCIAEEIKSLWCQGVVTTGSCCGHNKREGYIGVIPEHSGIMLAMGYQKESNGKDRRALHFIPKG